MKDKRARTTPLIHEPEQMLPSHLDVDFFTNVPIEVVRLILKHAMIDKHYGFGKFLRFSSTCKAFREIRVEQMCRLDIEFPHAPFFMSDDLKPSAYFAKGQMLYGYCEERALCNHLGITKNILGDAGGFIQYNFPSKQVAQDVFSKVQKVLKIDDATATHIITNVQANRGVQHIGYALAALLLEYSYDTLAKMQRDARDLERRGNEAWRRRLNKLHRQMRKHEVFKDIDCEGLNKAVNLAIKRAKDSNIRLHTELGGKLHGFLRDTTIKGASGINATQAFAQLLAWAHTVRGY